MSARCVLVINAGSSTWKISLHHVRCQEVAYSEEPSLPLQQVQTEAGGNVAEAIRSLWAGPNAVLRGPGKISTVGHRIVHGGAVFSKTVRITAQVKAAIAGLAPLAPLHNPVALAGVEAVEALLGPHVPQFAVFDTGFHRTLPDAASVYPGPYEWAEQGLRRYGFHGINHQYVARRAAQLLPQKKPLRLISCHLGSGCSLCAIRNGVSVDTTMGFTPLDGLMMATRSGCVDPGLLLHLQKEQGITAEQLEHTLNHESGLKGISGLSGDMQEILTEARRGNSRASLALDIYIHRLRAGIGAMVATLGGLDALIFTAGVGENSAEVRAKACEGFGFLGLNIDKRKNESSPTSHEDSDWDIAGENSSVRVLVIKAREDGEIAHACNAMSG